MMPKEPLLVVREPSHCCLNLVCHSTDAKFKKTKKKTKEKQGFSENDSGLQHLKLYYFGQDNRTPIFSTH